MSDRVKYTALLDAETDARFSRVVDALARTTGALPSHRGRRRPTRADVLRAALEVLEEDRRFAGAVRDRVLAATLAPAAANEVAEVVGELRRGVGWLATPDAQDSAAMLFEVLVGLVGELNAGDRADVLIGERLRSAADRIDALAVSAGGYDGLRPLLELARRLRRVRDAIDPADTVVCLWCNQDVRLLDDERAEGLEAHNDQAGSRCLGSGSPA